MSFICGVLALLSCASGQLNVHLESDGAYYVSVYQQHWLFSSPTFFRMNGMLFSTSDGSLKQIGEPKVTAGKDSLGPWNGQTLSYTAAGAKVSVSVRMYEDVGEGKVAVFTQVSVNINIVFRRKLHNDVHCTAMAMDELATFGFTDVYYY